MVTVCLVGVSGYGNVHYEDLLREVDNGRAELLAATIINQDEEAEKVAHLQSLGCAIHDDYLDMLSTWRDRAEFCFLPVGIHLHAPMTINALKSGMHVFVEKPAAATIQEVRAMQAAQRETGRFVAVGYQSMYYHDTTTMKRLILDGHLGEIRSIRCLALWPRNEQYYQRNRWAGQLRLGDAWVLDSPFNNAVAHQLNMICFLAGKQFAETAELDRITAELYHANPIQSADTACMRIGSVDGPDLYFIVSHASEGWFHPRIVVDGSEGTMTWTYHKELIVERPDGAREEFPVQPVAEREPIFDALLRRKDDPSAFVCDLDIAAAQTVCVNGAHESSPVRDLPAEWIEDGQRDGSPRKVIRGLDELAKQAFAEGKLFSELGAPWARPGRSICLRNYTEFHGPAEE
jgi:predicted dehydrogenase